MKKLIALTGLLALFFPAGDAGARLSPSRSVLDNGLVVVTSEQKALPMVTISLLVEAGSRLDPAERAGLANLAARLLTYGTDKRSATQIADALDFLGASLSTGCGEESATVSLTLLKKDLDAGLQLLAEVLTESSFPDEEIERQKQAVIAAIRAADEQPGHIAEVKFMEALFPDNPYGRPVEGTADSVKRADRAGLLDFYRKYYRPNRAILAVVGDVSEKEIVEKLRRAFQPWQKGGAPAEPPPKPVPGPPANIIMGHEGVTRSHPDYYAIQVMNYILGGGGFSSHMMDSIRTERGLAYSVYSDFEPQKYAGSFEVVMQTRNDGAAEAIRLAIMEMRRMQEQGVTEEELKDALDYLIGSFPLRFDTNRKVANFLAQVEFFSLGLDYPDKYPDIIRKVTRDDVLRVAKAYLHPERLIVIVVADQAKAALGKSSLDTDKGL